MPDHPMFVLPKIKISSRVFACLASAVVFLLTAAPLHAHHLPPGLEDVDEFEDGAAFLAGLRHPLLGMDHCFFAMAVGAFALATARRGSSRNLQLALLAGVSAGAMLGFNGVVLPGVQFSPVLTLAVLASLFLLRKNPSLMVPMGLTGLAALWQGNMHGMAWPLDAGSGFYLAGMMVMTSLLAFSGSAAVWLAHRTVAVRRSSSTVTSL